MGDIDWAECLQEFVVYLLLPALVCYRVKERLATDKPDQVDTFTSKVQTFVKSVLGEFKEYQFFCGEYLSS